MPSGRTLPRTRFKVSCSLRSTANQNVLSGNKQAERSKSLERHLEGAGPSAPANPILHLQVNNGCRRTHGRRKRLPSRALAAEHTPWRGIAGDAPHPDTSIVFPLPTGNTWKAQAPPSRVWGDSLVPPRILHNLIYICYFIVDILPIILSLITRNGPMCGYD